MDVSAIFASMVAENMRWTFGFALLNVFLCGVVLKLHTFPMNFIAGPSNCEVDSVTTNPSPSSCESTCMSNYTVTRWTLENNQTQCTENHEFVVDDHSARLSFLVWYGLSKSLMNFVTGRLCDRFGRKPILAAGWIVGVPGILCVLFADNFQSIAASNIFLGLNQAMSWSAVIYILIDVCSTKYAGLAVGAGETFGYTGAALTNALMGDVMGSSKDGTYHKKKTRTVPYIIEWIISVGGLMLTIALVRETLHLVAKSREKNLVAKSREEKTNVGEETKTMSSVSAEVRKRDQRDDPVDGATIITSDGSSISISMSTFVFCWTTLFNRSAMLTCLAGLCINLSTALVWGLIPEWLEDGAHNKDSASWEALTAKQVAVVTLCAELPKGLFQIVFGVLGDRYGRKWFVVSGLALSGVAVCGMALVGGTSSSTSVYDTFCLWGVVLGIGTAAMYSNCQAIVADLSLSPVWRSTAVGTYRFWRDLGYVIGACASGLLADYIGPAGAIGISGAFIVVVAAVYAVGFVEAKSDEGIGTLGLNADKRKRASVDRNDDDDDQRMLENVAGHSALTMDGVTDTSLSSPTSNGNRPIGLAPFGVSLAVERRGLLQ